MISQILKKSCDWIQNISVSICDREAVDKLFEEEHPDIVVNFAAESHVDRSIEDPGIFLQTNIIGTSVLMDACRKYGIQRYHQVSTDEVYGDLPLDRPDLFFTEETPIHTSSPYSSSKAAADLLVLAYHRTYGLPVTISRCSNNYGPYHFPEKLIPLMIANALADKPLPVYGEGLNVRDWLYVEDHCNHVVFIIRKDIEKEFKEVIGDRIASICSSHNVTVDYAFQDINDIPGTLPEGRTKPWGTGQAVLAAKKVIKTPFIVINADDYYGKEGFKAVHEYLVNGGKSCMAGFVLKNTLSDNGGVTRGICKMDDQNNLTEVVETKNIVKTATGAEVDGVAVDVNSLVSMNMWGLTPEFLDVLEEGFKEFFEKEVPGNPLKAEYLIPIFIGELLEQGKMSVKVLKTNDTWYGMTYHEDVAAVKGSFKEMLENGVYKADLFSDL